MILCSWLVSKCASPQDIAIFLARVLLVVAMGARVSTRQFFDLDCLSLNLSLRFNVLLMFHDEFSRFKRVHHPDIASVM